jgi:uncharacterized protein (TIGR03435 family)
MLFFAVAVVVLAQAPSPEKRVEFEVASIRPAVQDGDHDSDTDKGFLRTHNLTLKRLIANAYEIDIQQVLGGPNWLDSDSYDITAKIPAEFAEQTREKVPQMLQSLLADRFQLTIHREPRQISGYALVVEKKGPKLEPAKADANGSNIHRNNTHLSAQNVTMEAFAKHLSRNRDIGELVIDKTGLTGAFDFEMDWAAVAPDPTDDRPAIFAAMQPLGLRLEPAKVPIMAVVVDRAAKPAGN